MFSFVVLCCKIFWLSFFLVKTQLVGLIIWRQALTGENIWWNKYDVRCSLALIFWHVLNGKYILVTKPFHDWLFEEWSSLKYDCCWILLPYYANIQFSRTFHKIARRCNNLYICITAIYILPKSINSLLKLSKYTIVFYCVLCKTFNR